MEAPSTAFQPPLPGHLDFDRLRDHALARLHTLARAPWTDFNAHDPGMTLLEALCYALTELGYRTTYSVPDLLAGDTGSFFRPEQALPGAPVSAADMLRYLYAVSGAAQVRLDALAAGEQQPPLYFYPHGDTGAIGMEDFPGAQAIALQGLYRPSKGNWPYATANDAENTASGNALVAALQAVRGLCTDYANPVKQTPEQAGAPKPLFQTLGAESIPLYLTLEIAPDIIRVEAFLQRLFVQLAREITRLPRLQEPAQKPEDIPTEVWHELPAGQGYLAPAELERLQPRAALYASDLAQWLMDQPGVEQVRRISFTGQGITLAQLLSPEHITALDTGLAVDGLQLLRRGLLLNFNRDAVKAGVAKELATAGAGMPLGEGLGMGPSARGVGSPGRERKTGRYHSIRHDLPALYGMTQSDLEGLPTEQAARRKQFSAYLLFFEQLLANSFAQLDYGRRLFDLRQPVPANTYAHRNLRNLPLAGPVLDPAYETLSIETDPETRLRRLYDHLIARVGEQTYMAEPAKKLAFLQKWPELSAKRGLGIDYTDPSASAPLEARIQALLGLEDDERFYLVENILLRPLDGDRPDDEGNWLTLAPRPDPFSLRVSCVLPASGGRFRVENGEAGHNFRAFVCRIIREEVPAHIAIDWLWLPVSRMSAFTAAWLNYRTLLAGEETLARRIARDAVLDKLIDMPETALSPGFLIGWPAPLLNIPARQDGFAEPFGTAAIRLTYSQPGALYILCDRDGNMLMPGDGGITADISNANYQIGAGGPVTLITPTLGDEDTTFSIRVVKIAGEDSSGLVTQDSALIRSGYLQRKVFIRVGIRSDLVTRWFANNGALSDPLLVGYGQAVGVLIEYVQAEVQYSLIDDAGNDLCDQSFSGVEGGNVIVFTRPQQEDARVRVEARRTIGDQTYTKILEQPEQAGWVLVGPNPDLILTTEPVIPYGGTALVKIQDTQAGVNYYLDHRDIADHEFIHDGTAEAGDLTHLPVRLRLAGGYGWLMTRTGPIVGTGGEIAFEIPGLTEDSCFFASAEKIHLLPDGSSADQRVSFNTPAAAFLEPNPAVSFPSAEKTVQAGEILEMALSGPQRGVLYRFVRADAGDLPLGPPQYLHDTNPASPRLDGIGMLALVFYGNLIPTQLGSKIGVDFAVGPPYGPGTLPLISDPVPADPPVIQVGVVARKAQTALSVRLNGTFTLKIQGGSGRTAGAPGKPRSPRKNRKKP